MEAKMAYDKYNEAIAEKPKPDESRLLTDGEMAKVQDDKDACLAVIDAFDTCEGCSANCRAIAKAQLAKDMEWEDKRGFIKEAEYQARVAEAKLAGKQEQLREVVDAMTVAQANGNTERQRLTNLCSLARKYEAKLKEWGITCP